MKIKDIFTRQTEIGEHTRAEFLNLGSLSLLLVGATEGFESLKWDIPPVDNLGQFVVASVALIGSAIAVTMSGGLDHEDQPIPRPARVINQEGEI